MDAQGILQICYFQELRGKQSSVTGKKIRLGDWCLVQKGTHRKVDGYMSSTGWRRFWPINLWSGESQLSPGAYPQMVGPKKLSNSAWHLTSNKAQFFGI